MNESKTATGLSVQLGSLGNMEERIVRLVGKPRVSIENVMMAVDFDVSDILSAIRHLINSGYLYLVVVAYPWGVEFEFQLTEQGQNYLDENIRKIAKSSRHAIADGTLLELRGDRNGLAVLERR